MADSIIGMSEQAAREYITKYLTHLKLCEKQYIALEEELSKWTHRVALARSKGDLALAAEAAKEEERLKVKILNYKAEIETLKNNIENMQRELQTLSAKERSVDPDLLEQELLMTRGYMPGEEEKAQTDIKFKEIEKDTEMDAALLALKAKIREKKE